MRGSVKKRGDSWRCRWYDDDGNEKQRSFPRKGLAEAFLREQIAALHSGTYVDPHAGSERFGAYAARWLEQQHVRPGTARLHEQRLRLHLNPVIGDVPLRAIRRSHVVEIITRMVDGGLSPLVVKYTISQLRAILDVAVADRLLTTNVAADRSIALPRKARQPVVPLTTAEIDAIARAIEPRFRALVLLGAATGLRSGELRGLTADRITPALHIGPLDVAPRQGVVRVDRQLAVGRVLAPTKTDSSNREVSIGSTVMAVLRDHLRAYGLGDGGFVFTNACGTPIDASQLSVAWSRAVERAAVRADVTVHDLRHHHASALLSQGVNVAAVAKRLGHASPTITLSTYSHVMPSDEQRVLDVSEDIAARLA